MVGVYKSYFEVFYVENFKSVDVRFSLLLDKYDNKSQSHLTLYVSIFQMLRKGTAADTLRPNHFTKPVNVHLLVVTRRFYVCCDSDF